MYIHVYVCVYLYLAVTKCGFVAVPPPPLLHTFVAGPLLQILVAGPPILFQALSQKGRPGMCFRRCNNIHI